MLRTINSTNPLVFINTPSVKDSLTGTIHITATANVPKIFPAHAVDVISKRSPQSTVLRSLVTSVFKPLEAKYNGSSNVDTKSSILVVNLLANSLPLGIVSPKTNPPKIECNPIVSVTNPDNITPARVKHTYISGNTSFSLQHLRATRFITGRTRIIIAATNATPEI